MKKALSLCMAAMALLITVEARATTMSCNFDQNNSTLAGGPWANITLSDDANDGRVHVTVDLLRAGYDSIGPNFGLQDFYLNENTGDANFASNVSVLFASPGSWSYRYSASSDLGGVGPYGKFELLASGTGADRTRYLDFYLSSLAGELSLADFVGSSPHTPYMFAGHIGGFSDLGMDGNTYESAQFASSCMPAAPVPEPGTVMMLGAGLLGWAVAAKRRKAAWGK